MASSTLRSNGGESKPGASTLPGDPDSKQLRARTHVRGAAHAAVALDSKQMRAAVANLAKQF